MDYTITEKETSPGKTEVERNKIHTKSTFLVILMLIKFGMQILIVNNQYYKFLGRDINMISLIKLDTEDGKVVAHQDRYAYICFYIN